MAKRMLIDATHSEETRVVVVKGTRLEEFDFETSTKLPLKGNIYLAKVVRVEPSLQAAFVEYGGNRHGFLAFSEIHPDYYQIPIADRKALLARQAAEEREAEAAEEREAESEAAGATDAGSGAAAESDGEATMAAGAQVPMIADEAAEDAGNAAETTATAQGDESEEAAPAREGELGSRVETVNEIGSSASEITSVGGDELDEEPAPRRSPPPYRSYKIQEVIKRRQVLLIQVVKEERGNKGAALTTFISLAGRYCVLMPNTPRGGGISRKIVSATDRKRLKAIVSDLEVPKGMGVILRTAGLDRSKAEIKRDYEYLVRLWDNVRELTLRSTAPCLVYEEGSLIKRAIRDYYSGEIDEILVEGEEGYRVAKDFMRMLMPSHAKKVQPYRDRVHLFHRYQVEQQFDSMYNPTVQLRSGGYIVINPTEALVSIDVNSGKSTREHNIEETAYKTNLEAAEEISRQLRLRDLAGLIVIDFIDMQDQRNTRNVERRLKDGLKSDRARIQVGRISAFGLMEMSRQRLRPSLLESSTELCPHCEGRGYLRSTESTALHILRAIEDEGIRDRSAEITVHVATAVAFYLLNQKRDSILDIENRYQMKVLFEPDDSLMPPNHRIDRRKTRAPLPEGARAPLIPIHTESVMPEDIEEDEAEETAAVEATGQAPSQAPAGEEGGEQRRRRRRRRKRRPGEEGADRTAEGTAAAAEEAGAEGPAAGAGEGTEEQAGAGAGAEAGFTESEEDGEARRRRRRGRRGGRRRRREDEGAVESTTEGALEGAMEGVSEPGAEQPYVDAEGAEAPRLFQPETETAEPAFSAAAFTAAPPVFAEAPQPPEQESTTATGPALTSPAAELPAAEPVAEEAAEPAPARRAPRRRRKVAAAPAEEAAAEAPAVEAMPVETPAVETLAVEAAAVEAAAVEAAAVEAAAEDVAAAMPEAEPASALLAPEIPVLAVEPPADTIVPEELPPAPSDVTAAGSLTSFAIPPADVAPSAEAADAQAEQQVEAPAEQAPEAPAEPAPPPRRGWWRR